jgi:hypothetical protein
MPEIKIEQSVISNPVIVHKTDAAQPKPQQAAEEKVPDLVPIKFQNPA